MSTKKNFDDFTQIADDTCKQFQSIFQTTVPGLNQKFSPPPLKNIGEVDVSSKRESEALQRIADAATNQASSKKDEVEILREQLELNKRLAKEARAEASEARREARFAKRATVVTLIFSGFSILIAVAALFQPLWLPMLLSRL